MANDENTYFAANLSGIALHREVAALEPEEGQYEFGGMDTVMDKLADNGGYAALRNDASFQSEFYGALAQRMGIKPVLNATLPEGVTAQRRTDGAENYVFLMNFNPGNAQWTWGMRHSRT